VLWHDAAVEDPRAAIAANPLWYHTIEVAPGLETPGWFDLRPTVERLPWPDVRGKRCLDVGTYDGFFAFELERRGAAEVVATDISDHNQWDWSWAMRNKGGAYLASVAGPEKGLGFRIAREALGSKVVKHEISIYDLSPEALGGQFDVVVCGSLMLHLKSPVTAMERIRGMCRPGGEFMSTEEIDPLRTLLSPRRPAMNFHAGHLTQWMVSNTAAHRALVECAGFKVERTVRPYAESFGKGHEPTGLLTRRNIITRIVTGGAGVPHAALLARAVDAA
jgi:2-polyprenyl-3-methyl-5-hydroxy-6-metoxy-1,4-benzoquinol methylase